MRQIVVIAHNIRSAHNVGSLLRTAEGLGVQKLYLTGYTPYPSSNTETRLPHLARKINDSIKKTALGAEITQAWDYQEDVDLVLAELKRAGFVLAVLEQTKTAVPLPDYKTPNKIALLLGSEVTGVSKELLSKLPIQLVIPMYGQKESFNVVQAAAMALYHFRFTK